MTPGFGRRSVVALAAATAAWIALQLAAGAQTNDLKLRILIAPETLVCGGQGYAAYGGPGGAPCKSLTVAEIGAWDRRQFVEQTVTIPPSAVALGDFAPLVDSYSDLVIRAAAIPGGRKAAVFVFEWPQPITGAVTLSQAAAGWQTIPEKTSTTMLRSSRRWIYHERADALSPSYGVLWKLSAPRATWQFWIQ